MSVFFPYHMCTVQLYKNWQHLDIDIHKPKLSSVFSAQKGGSSRLRSKSLLLNVSKSKRWLQLKYLWTINFEVVASGDLTPLVYLRKVNVRNGIILNPLAKKSTKTATEWYIAIFLLYLFTVSVEKLQLQTLIQLHPPGDPRLLQIFPGGGHRLQLLLHLATGVVVSLQKLLTKQFKSLDKVKLYKL